jgi:hypothetical protein
MKHNTLIRTIIGLCEPGKYLDHLQRCRVLTESGAVTEGPHGFWGGRTADGGLAVTTWLNEYDDRGFHIYKRENNKGGLKRAWEDGSIRSGAEVKVVFVYRDGEPIALKRSLIAPGKWRVVEVDVVKGRDHAIIDMVEGARGRTGDVLPLLLRGIADISATGSKLVMPLFLTMLAEVYGIMARPKKGSPVSPRPRPRSRPHENPGARPKCIGCAGAVVVRA